VTRPLRVLHCLYDVAGNAAALARAEREIGLASTAVVLRRQSYRFAADEVLCGDDDGYLRQELRRFGLLARAVRVFDVVHFNFGRSLMPPWKGARSAEAGGMRGARGRAVDAYLRALWLRDLPLLRAVRRPMFVTYQGDDARQSDYVRAHFEADVLAELEPGYYSAASDRAKRRAIARFDRYAAGIYALNPDLLDVLPQRACFMPYASVDPRQWRPRPPRGDGELLVVHAPTHRGIKGTRHIVAAVERLQRQGVRFDFRLVEGLTHEQASDLYEEADLVVDQLLVGWYGAFAVEAMALAKPVVCFVRDGDLHRLPTAMRADLPLIDATPETVESTLRQWITGPRSRLIEQGRRSRAYAERWHDPLRIARGLAADYAAALRRVHGEAWLQRRAAPQVR
jgi:nucleotide-binding universal stress UspA family protein